MVKEYMLTRVDLTRAAMSPTLAVANDLLEDWQRELLLCEVVPEGKEGTNMSPCSSY
jgi:hypothetical protein